MRGPANAHIGATACRTKANRILRALTGAALLLTLAYGVQTARSGWVVLKNPSDVSAARLEPVFLAAESEDGAAAEGSPADPEACQTVVFFHIPKTGGESLNDLWREKPNSQRLFGWENYRWIGLRTTGLGHEQQKRVMTNLRPWMSVEPMKRHSVLELHCGDALSFMQAKQALATMRVNHEKNNCGLYAFTILRSPLEWVVSLYDDICHRRLRGHKESCPQKEDMTSRQEMLEFPHKDGMVSYLLHGWDGWNSPGPVDEFDVEDVSEVLRGSLDLVVTTKEVPKLRHFLTTRFAARAGSLTAEQEETLKGREVQNVNMEKTVTVSDFTQDELQRLNATVQLDWKLYQHFARGPRPWSTSRS